MTGQPNFSLQWLDFNSHKEIIRNLRKRVFVDEQSLKEFMIDSSEDPKGLHLGLFDNENLVSIISLFIYHSNDPYLAKARIKSERPYVIQYSRRAELPEYRSKKLGSFMVAHAMKSLFELFQPDTMFAVLIGSHRELKDMYLSMYGFNISYELDIDGEPSVVLVMNDVGRLKNLSLTMRNASLLFAEKQNMHLPDLAHHILNSPSLKDLYQLEPDATNRYLQPLSLHDELPRLSAQARMLFLTQQNIWEQILQTRQDLKNIMDAGCGPGVYIANLSKMEVSKGRVFTGIDISDELITYASFSHPKLKWLNTSIYETGLKEGSYDLINGSFLFIHLLNPYLALREIHRILKDEGILYITDVNDTTFKGPDIINDMVEKHREIYEGNRRIMLEMNYLTEQAGFTLLEEHTIVATNTGNDNKPLLEGNTLSLGKWTMWAMFSFMGQRDEIKDQYGEAESYYLNNNDLISIEIQTKIYKKVKSEE